ncbi:MAG: DUF1569 domain-containing protein [Saprospiraceae bacterium]|nr:DUF1569 domain-containing protein [Saprospiraceae bacterium]
MSTKKEFLTEIVPTLLQKLKVDQDPQFGLMTPQHMIEHLTSIIKSSVKRYGEPDPALAERQAGFKRFIHKGAVFKHRNSDKTKADLPKLKYEAFEEAVPQLVVAIERFYNHYEQNPDFKAYHNFMGELDYGELETFHHSHVCYHFWQFGLLPEYP